MQNNLGCSLYNKISEMRNWKEYTISYPEQLATLFDFTDGRVTKEKRAKGLGSSLKNMVGFLEISAKFAR